MQLQFLAVLFACQSIIASGKPAFDHNVKDLFRDGSHDSILRNAARHALVDLERRVTTIPNLVPTTTVNLGTDSTGTTQMVSPLRDGGTIGTVATTTLPKSIAGADPTGEAGGRNTGKGQAQSTSSKGDASSAHTVPMIGMIVLGLLGL